MSAPPVPPPGAAAGYGAPIAPPTSVPKVASSDPLAPPAVAATGAPVALGGGVSFPARPTVANTPLFGAPVAAPAARTPPIISASSSASPLTPPFAAAPPHTTSPVPPPPSMLGGPAIPPPAAPQATGPLFVSPPTPSVLSPAPPVGAPKAAPPTLFTPGAVSSPLAPPPMGGSGSGAALYTPATAAAPPPLGAPPMGPPKGPLGAPSVFMPAPMPMPGPGAAPAPPVGPPKGPIGPPPLGGPSPLAAPAVSPLLAPPSGPIFLSPPSTGVPPPGMPGVLTPSTAPPRGPLGPPPMGPNAPRAGPPLAAAGAPLAAPPAAFDPLAAAASPTAGAFTSTAIPSAPGSAATPKSMKIDPTQMPSPMALHSNRVLEYKTRSSGSAPPPSVVRYFVTDEGVTSPHFMRFSAYQMPTTSSLTNQSCIPLGAVITPFAEDIYPNEEVELVSDLKEKGPPRCIRCKAYPSPYWVWLEGGRAFRCNICDSVNDTPNEYYAPTEPSGLRTDLHQRPELRVGTVEFAVGAEYHHKKERLPAPLAMLFLVEVTAQSVRAGVLASFCAAMKALLPTIPPNIRIGIATFDSSAHYYALQKGQTQPHMLVMADAAAGFLPASRDAFCVPFDDDHRALVEALLNKLPNMWASNPVTSSATGAALQSAVLALRGSGGRIVLVQSSMASLGAGALKPRFDPKVLGTEREAALFGPPEQMNFWADLGSKCSEMKIAVDTLLMADASIDFPTQHAITRSTCGQTFWLGPPKGSVRDEIAFTGVLHRLLHRTTAQDALLRVRCSKGLTVGEFLCNHHQSAFQDEADLGGLDGDKSIAFTIKHEEELPDKKDATFQAALLYTTKSGERRVRVFNAALPVTTQLPLVFRMADLDATLTLIARQAVMHFLKEKSLTKVRAHLTDTTVALLAAYRKYCSATSSAGQLILPEALKLLPAYVLGLLKHAVFRPAIDTLPDERFHWLTYIMNESPGVLMNLLYPRLYALHRIPPNCGVSADNGGSVMLPPPLRLAQESVEPFGAYLVADDAKLVLFITRGASEDLLKDALGVPTVDHVDPRLHVLPDVDTDINRRIAAIIAELRKQRIGLYPSLHVVRQRDPLEVRLFASSLVEEKITAGDPYNYVDWLCFLHKEIMSKINQ